MPDKHWQQPRNTNRIESTIVTIRHRAARTKGCVTRHILLHMMFKLGIVRRKHWRRLRGFAHLAKLINEVKSVNAEKVTEPASL